MPITYISDHDWEKHTTFDIENLFGIDYENDDSYTISTIHVSSNYDIESSKLGDEVFENPFSTDDYIFETSPSSKNDDMFTNEHTLEDNYSIAYDDTIPPVFDNYNCSYYNYNDPHETCHSYGGITQNHPFNIQLVYHFRVLYDVLLLLLMRRIFLMWRIMILLCIWIMVRMFQVTVILWILSMMLLKVIMREGNMVIFIS